MDNHVQSLSSERPNCDFNQVNAWVNAITGDPDNAVFNWRFIHDKDKAVPAIKRRGTLAQVWFEACDWSAKGYGIFATVNEMDGTGYDANGRPVQGQTGDTLEHVAGIRAHMVDLDNLAAMQNLQRAAAHVPAPWFAVETSPGKAHVYWPLHGTQGGADREQYRLLQRKLRQLFDGDKAVVDATRVLRVPGFLHQKGEPHLVTCYQLPGYGQPISRDMLAISVAHVNAVDDGGGRHPLGEPELAAPSAEWARYALETMPVEGMDHNAFISFTAAWKQAAWTVLDHDEMWFLWLNWCQRFGEQSKGTEYNLKHWSSITDTEVGWKSLLRQNPALNGAFMFYGSQHQPVARSVESAPSDVSPIPIQSPQALGVGDLMLAEDCKEYFKGCTFIVSEKKILTPNGQLMDKTQFDGAYGGPRFVIAPNNTAPTDEPWKAALRSFFWRIPFATKMRFHPDFNYGDFIDDNNKIVTTDSKDVVRGFNAYRKHEFATSNEDPTPFLSHVGKLIPDVQDREHLFDYIAHNAKFPGHKIPWAPFIQSAEGAGKGVIKHVLLYLAGDMQSHVPNAKELSGNGSKFNSWMRNKTLIAVDEVKTDEKRDLIEILKPLLSEGKIEFQGKGADQSKGDNYANWVFFSNHKDAIPIDDSSRRFAIFYSAIQSKADLDRLGMDDQYFRQFYSWLGVDSAGNVTHGRGLQAVAGWLMRRNIARGSIPMRGPVTTSEAEAIELGRGALSQVMADAIEGNDIPGLMGGWVHTRAATQVLIDEGMKQPAPNTLRTVLQKMGYHKIQKDQRTWANIGGGKRGTLWNKDPNARAENFAFDQRIEGRGVVVNFPPGQIPQR